jgi:hypothetical protein
MKKMYVVITKCDLKTAWYNDKVGTIQKVSNELFPPNYVVINRKQNKKGLYLIINKEDTCFIIPSLFEELLVWLNFTCKYKK